MESRQPSLLTVLAHPDDESFGMGGTLAFYAKRGVAVHLVCATRGEVGEVDPAYLEGFNSVGERRESELRCAAGILGLTSVHFLGYRDSGMPGSPDNRHPNALAAAPLEDVAEKVAHHIRLLRPEVVLTFDPIGGYRHPDHIAIHNATVKAFQLAGDPQFSDGLPLFQPQKLYFHIIPKKWLKLGIFVLSLLGKDPHHFGKNRDIDLASLVAEGDFPTHARINYRSVAASKDAAAACHLSQLGGASLRQGPMRLIQNLLGSSDLFMCAYPLPPSGRVERDLFSGIELSSTA
jgi:N-acetyl-1-D-myo-inositol-2-amino-2-deoxy-alpha-D-glucopyranoside deacetylase